MKGIALDIDETISYTVEYWVRQLSKKFGNPKNLTPREIFEQYRLIQNFPHWQSKEAQDWIDKDRNSNEIQKDLPLIKNSNHSVNKLNKIIPVVCYLTTRPQSVLEGTTYWLEKHNFPKAKVIGKPAKITYEDGTKWKANMLQKLFPQVQGIVDDNLHLIDYLPKTYKGYIFLYDIKNFSSDFKNVIVCPTWEDVLENAAKVYK
ncbi:MAG: hypothetical protein A3B38_02415 [Candidatus Levybacteria bacterium RIFCSPLOWO2_01_FULL_36_13]|nr:MAG: hypothetical protein A2684_03610 [Candidatus Levybacteria bacterium RIFCSPHIGHO2_01_FULL_36_15b]OGH35139.1 MAG: hypothetical protein A3B38_02415 [Candidatus Levybacteria bacterium RIFCSPLOWO2_01_FULL_36_13]